MQTIDGTMRDWPGQTAASPITYARSQRLLGAALSRLAATGYAAPPDEAMDLIHDFYVEAWGDLMARFDPSLAKLETYVFACFLRFARPRIAKLERLRSMLMSPDEMESIVDADADREAAGVDRSDIAAARHAIAVLPDDSRRLLTGYLDDATPSERDLAARFALTRYQLRVRLADALGTVAVHLGAADGFAEPDRAIARALWADNCSSREAAGLLHLPITEIQAARRRIFGRLVQAVKGPKHMSIPQAPHTASHAVTLVASALAREATEQDVAAVREHRDAIWAYLEAIDQDRARSLYEMAGPARLAAFYEALGDEPSVEDDFVSDELAPFLEARDGEAQAIGEAFVQTLLVNLPGELTRFATFFGAAPTLEPDLYEMLMDDPSVAVAGAPAAALARYGITPVTVAEAARAIGHLAKQVGGEAGGAAGKHIILCGTPIFPAEPQDGVITRAMAVKEFTLSFALPPETVERLFDWIIAVAARKPLLFDGYHTTPQKKDLLLVETGTTEQNLFIRWKSETPAVAGPAAVRRRNTAAA